MNLRTQSKVKIRQPLSTLYVRPRDAADRRVLENPDYAAQILEEANIKNLVLIEDETKLVKVRFKPDAKKLGPRAGKHLKAIAQALEQAMPSAEGCPYSRKSTVKPSNWRPEKSSSPYEGPENLKCSLEQGTFMALDTTLTPELLQEGLARDFNRLVQDQRKAMNLNISDRIVVNYPPRRGSPKPSPRTDYLRHELLAERLEPSTTQNGGAKLSLSGEEIFVTITRV